MIPFQCTSTQHVSWPPLGRRVWASTVACVHVPPSPEVVTQAIWWPRRGNYWCFTVVFFVGLNIQWRWQCKLGFVSITTGSMPWPRWKYNFRCREIRYQPLKQRKSFPHSVFLLHSNPVLQLRMGRTQTIELVGTQWIGRTPIYSE